MPEKRHQKVIRLRILKPAGDMLWDELGKLLRDARYRVYRLANLAVSEAYLSFHMFRRGDAEEFTPSKIGELNRQLRQMLREEDCPEDELARFSKTGAVPDTICGALSHYKIKGLTSKSKWREVIRGKSSLATFRLDMAIPVRCDKAGYRRLEKMPSGDIEVDLMICTKPYPRVILQTGDVGGGARAILDRLLENVDQSNNGHRQRCFEIKQDSRTHKWWLYITYDFPASEPPALDPKIVVGVDLGVSCPAFAAINNGHARLGRRQFQALGARMKSLQRQVMARRRGIQRGGRVSLSADTARSGHGRKRKLKPIEPLEGRINDAYRTLNHQLSAALIDFAKNHGAGVIQIEDLSTLKDVLRGTFLGGRWRYHQLQTFLKYKAEEAGIKLQPINPRYTSQRCSKCGVINRSFDRTYRDAHGERGRPAKFICTNPDCGYDADPDYNAAQNLATLDIETLIDRQCELQGIDTNALSQVDR